MGKPMIFLNKMQLIGKNGDYYKRQMPFSANGASAEEVKVFIHRKLSRSLYFLDFEIVGNMIEANYRIPPDVAARLPDRLR